MEEAVQAENNRPRHRPGLCFGIILAVAFALRLINLGKYSFWHDEVAYLVTVKSLVQIISGHLAVKGSLFFHIQAYLWSYLGPNLFVLRLLPVLWSVSSVAITYIMSARLYDRRTACLASFLMAVSPFSIHYAQEFKMYSVMICLSLMSYYLFYLFIIADECVRRWRFLAIVNALMLYTHYYGVIVIVVETLYLYIFCGQSGKKTPFLFSLLGSFLLYFPWFLVIELTYCQVIGVFNASWIPAWNLLKPFLSLFHYSAGYHSPLKVGLGLTFIFLGLAVWAMVHDLKGQKITGTNPTIYLAMILCGSMIVTSLIALWNNIWLDRYLCFMFGPFILGAGRGLACIRKPMVQAIVVLILLLGLVLPVLFIYQNRVPREDKTTVYAKKDVIGAARVLDRNVKPGDLVINTSWSTIIPLKFHMTRSLAIPYVVLSSGSFRHVSHIGGDFIYDHDLYPHLLDRTITGHDRIWLVHSSWPTLTEELESRMVKEWMLTHCSLEENESFLGIDLFLFRQCGSNIRQ